jgi:hypothetical protein
MAEPGWELADFETPAGADAPTLRAVAGEPRFIYRGVADQHWRGQPCHLTWEASTDPDERIVVMACGCRASVPWWTLETAG